VHVEVVISYAEHIVGTLFGICGLGSSTSLAVVDIMLIVNLTELSRLKRVVTDL
jgi:hypothetical protein